MRHNYIASRDGERTTPPKAVEGLPVVATRRIDLSRYAGFAILLFAAVLAILNVSTPVLLAGSWFALAFVSGWLWLLISRVHHTQVRERADALEIMAAFKDMVTGPHDTNLPDMARRLHELERDHTQLSAVVDQCVTWDHIDGGRPDEDAA